MRKDVMSRADQEGTHRHKFQTPQCSQHSLCVATRCRTLRAAARFRIFPSIELRKIWRYLSFLLNLQKGVHYWRKACPESLLSFPRPRSVQRLSHRDHGCGRSRLPPAVAAEDKRGLFWATAGTLGPEQEEARPAPQLLGPPVRSHPLPGMVLTVTHLNVGEQPLLEPKLRVTERSSSRAFHQRSNKASGTHRLKEKLSGTVVALLPTRNRKETRNPPKLNLKPGLFSFGQGSRRSSRQDRSVASAAKQSESQLCDMHLIRKGQLQSRLSPSRITTPGSHSWCGSRGVQAVQPTSTLSVLALHRLSTSSKATVAELLQLTLEVATRRSRDGAANCLSARAAHEAPAPHNRCKLSLRYQVSDACRSSEPRLDKAAAKSNLYNPPPPTRKLHGLAIARSTRALLLKACAAALVLTSRCGCANRLTAGLGILA